MGIRYKEAREKLERDLDIQNEDFISSEELIALFNDAITEAEGVIHKLGVEDEYFFKIDTIPTAEGDTEITLPCDLYQNKIRGLAYRESGTRRYKIQFYRKRNKLINIMDDESVGDVGQDHKAYIQHPDADSGYILNVVPAIRITSQDAMRIAYIRQCSRVTSDSSIIDVPHMQFIYAHVAAKVKLKEKTLEDADILQLRNEKQNMINFLTNQIVDDEDTVEMDLSIYEEMS